MMGEFGRTPVMTPTAGRGHWTNCMSMIVAGGRLPCGQVIGSTDPRGYDIASAPVRPADLAATVFKHLDIDLSAQWINPQGARFPLSLKGAGRFRSWGRGQVCTGQECCVIVARSLSLGRDWAPRSRLISFAA